MVFQPADRAIRQTSGADRTDLLIELNLRIVCRGIATLIQSFQGGCRQRLQLGCAWWVNDQFDGMKRQLTMMAEQSLIANFTGMLTDSRSFLSYPRHEYFRRVLCHTIGEWVEQGRVPEDEAYLGKIVEDICYNNAHDYFGFFE